MKIAAITRFKHGALFEILRKHDLNQSEFAKLCKINVATMGIIINLRRRPSELMCARLLAGLKKLDENIDIETLFPDSYIGFSRSLKIVQVQDVEPAQLEQYAHHQRLLLEDAQVPFEKDFLDKDEVFATMERVCTEREKDILKSHFLNDETYGSIGRRYNVVGYTISVQAKHALEKIRHALNDPHPWEIDSPVTA